MKEFLSLALLFTSFFLPYFFLYEYNIYNIYNIYNCIINITYIKLHICMYVCMYVCVCVCVCVCVYIYIYLEAQ